MSRRAKSCLLIALLIFVPLRTIAAVIQDCNLIRHEAVEAADVEHTHEGGGGTHHHHSSSSGDHCGSAAFAAPPVNAVSVCPVASERIAGEARLLAGPVLDRPDPPPLPI